MNYIIIIYVEGVWFCNVPQLSEADLINKIRQSWHIREREREQGTWTKGKLDLVHPTHQHLMATCIPPLHYFPHCTSVYLIPYSHPCSSHLLFSTTPHFFLSTTSPCRTWLQPEPKPHCHMTPIDWHISLVILLSSHLIPLQTTFLLHLFIPVFPVLCLFLAAANPVPVSSSSSFYFLSNSSVTYSSLQPTPPDLPSLTH